MGSRSRSRVGWQHSSHAKNAESLLMKNTPHISINKLVEYCIANGPRRTAIIENILQPKGYLVDTGYNDIERAFAHYVSSKGHDATKLRDLDLLFQRREARSEHEDSRILNALDMIERAATLPLPLLRDVAVQPAFEAMSRFEIAGLIVSVNPTNILLSRQRGRTTAVIGIAKPYFSMTAPLTTSRSSEKANLHGAILHWYCETFLQHLGEPRPNLCLSIDVYAQRITEAPSSFISRRRHITSCAQEIYDRGSP